MHSILFEEAKYKKYDIEMVLVGHDYLSIVGNARKSEDGIDDIDKREQLQVAVLVYFTM